MAISVVLFDLDNTLYPASNGLMQHLDARIGVFFEETFRLSPEDSLRLRRQYYHDFGTTLRGIQHHHGDVDTERYLQYVHDLAFEDFLVADALLDAALEALPARKVVFTNSPREYAEQVLARLGIKHHFERIFDVRFFDFVCKPDPSCYERVLDELGIQGTEAIMIEDMAKNLPPAARLGITTILLESSEQQSELADYVVPDVLGAVELAGRLLSASYPEDEAALVEASLREGATNGKRGI
jgi:putative hydrolase of the HAD superfamily